LGLTFGNKGGKGGEILLLYHILGARNLFNNNRLRKETGAGIAHSGNIG